VTGTIPTQWSALSALRDVYLRFNRLSGTIPAEWSTLVSLERFYAGSNQLEGTIPSQWGALPALEQFDATSNLLNGTLPSTMPSTLALLCAAFLRAASHSFGPLAMSPGTISPAHCPLSGRPCRC